MHYGYMNAPRAVSLVLRLLAIVFGIVAALLWFKASKIEVREGSPQAKSGILLGSYDIRIDVISTSREQGKWNGWAAIATGLSVLMQAFVPLI
jgi:hypothetical protein